MREFSSPIAGPDAARQAAFGRWLAGVAPRHDIDPARILPAVAGARSPQVWRVAGTNGSCIAIDALPPHDIRPRVHAATLLREAGIDSPRVLEVEVGQGFLLLEDYGSTDLDDALRAAPPAQAEATMRQVLSTLVQLETRVPASALPRCERGRFEAGLALFPACCVERHYGIRWNEAQQAAWHKVVGALTASALALPLVAVHGDFAPRQLRVRAAGSIGVLGGGDACAGPIGLDLVTLLRDAASDGDEAQELDRAVRWWEQARRAGLQVDVDFGECWRTLEWLGLMRDLTKSGWICRESPPEGADPGAAELPRLLAQAGKVALRYAPLKPLLRLLEPLSGARVESGFTF